MCARRKQSVIFKIDRTMNYFLLAETDFFRLINEAGDCNMETAYTAFATQVIELCNGGMDMNLSLIHIFGRKLWVLYCRRRKVLS